MLFTSDIDTVRIILLVFALSRQYHDLSDPPQAFDFPVTSTTVVYTSICKASIDVHDLGK
jgi:hypothetical protein